MDECALCLGSAGDAGMSREQVWEDELWRLSTSIGPGDVTLGFARCTQALKDATGCELVYVYVFGGGIPHLHLHLAPHHAGDALCEAIIRGEVEEQPLPSGATAIISKDFPELPEADARAVADRVRALLA